MHLHLPKAIHGWREFVKEVGIIVLGVLIALGFEQLMQMWHWHEEVRHTRQALAYEVQLGSIFAIERVAVQPCLGGRITHLASRLSADGPRWSGDPMVQPHYRSGLVPVRSIESSLPRSFISPSRPWLSDEWQMAKSTGVISHMGRQEVGHLEFFFSNVDRLRALEDEERTAASQLAFLSFNQELQPDTRARALATLGQLDSIETSIAILSQQMLPGVRSMDLRFEPMSFGRGPLEFARARAAFIDADRILYGPCVRDTAPRI